MRRGTVDYSELRMTDTIFVDPDMMKGIVPPRGIGTQNVNTEKNNTNHFARSASILPAPRLITLKFSATSMRSLHHRYRRDNIQANRFVVSLN